MLQLHRHLAVAHLRVLEYLWHIVDLPDTHIGLGQEVEPLFAGLSEEDLLQFCACVAVSLGWRTREISRLHAAVFEIGRLSASHRFSHSQGSVQPMVIIL